MASDKGFKQIVQTWLRKYKVGTLPEHMRTAKPNSQDLMEIAKPTLIGIPILVILYLIWDLTGFATGLAVAVALAILDATRPLRGGYWLMKRQIAQKLKIVFCWKKALTPKNGGVRKCKRH